MLLRFLRKYFESSSCGSFSLASLIRKHDSRQCHNSLHWHSGCGNCLPQPMCTLVIKTQRSICMFHHCWAIGKFPRWHRHGYGAYLIVYSTVTQCDMSFILWSVVVYTRPARQVFHAPRASITTVRPSFQLDLSPTHWLFAVTSEKGIVVYCVPISAPVCSNLLQQAFSLKAACGRNPKKYKEMWSQGCQQSDFLFCESKLTSNFCPGAK